MKNLEKTMRNMCYDRIRVTLYSQVYERSTTTADLRSAVDKYTSVMSRYTDDAYHMITNELNKKYNGNEN